MSGERMTAAEEAYFRRLLDAGLDLGRAQAAQVFRELDAVRAERDEARGQLINARLCFEDMERQRDEARKDSARLDWLAEFYGLVGDDVNATEWKWDCTSPHSLRDSVDAAMSKVAQ